MTTFEIYLIMQINPIKFGIIGSTIAAMIIYLFHLAIQSDAAKMDNEYVPVYRYRIGISIFFFFFFSLMIPSRNTLIAMYVAPPILQDEIVQRIPGKVLKLIDKRLDEMLSGVENASSDN